MGPPFMLPNPYRLYYPLRKRKSRTNKVMKGTWKVLSWPFVAVSQEIRSLRYSYRYHNHSVFSTGSAEGGV